MKTLVIINAPPYGTERAFNALRLAMARQNAGAEMTVSLMADAVGGAKHGQTTPSGYYNLERMLKRVLASSGSVRLCGTCMDARGLRGDEIIAGAARSTMDELAATTASADKVLVF